MSPLVTRKQRRNILKYLIHELTRHLSISLTHLGLQASMGKPTNYQYDTYREELGKAYSLFGYALWDPDPGQYPHVRVGDVGFTRAGKFHRLFNTLLPEDDPSHQILRYGLPEYYEQLQVSLPNHIDSGTLPSGDLHSHGVTIKSGGLAGTVPVKG